MKKLFVSQPMKDLSDEEIIEVRKNAACAVAKSLGEPVLLLDSFFKSAPRENRPLWFLGKSLQVLSEADVAFFVDGWKTSRGCAIEHICAEEYGVKIIEGVQL